MSLQVRLERVAEEEFAEGAVWYYRRSEKAAEAFITAVERTLARISENPEVFPVAHRSIRAAVVAGFPYTIYFVIQPAECVALAVHHGKRSPRRWMRLDAG